MEHHPSRFLSLAEQREKVARIVGIDPPEDEELPNLLMALQGKKSKYLARYYFFYPWLAHHNLLTDEILMSSASAPALEVLEGRALRGESTWEVVGEALKEILRKEDLALYGKILLGKVGYPTVLNGLALMVLSDYISSHPECTLRERVKLLLLNHPSLATPNLLLSYQKDEDLPFLFRVLTLCSHWNEEDLDFFLVLKGSVSLTLQLKEVGMLGSLQKFAQYNEGFLKELIREGYYTHDELWNQLGRLSSAVILSEDLRQVIMEQLSK